MFWLFVTCTQGVSQESQDLRGWLSSSEGHGLPGLFEPATGQEADPTFTRGHNPFPARKRLAPHGHGGVDLPRWCCRIAQKRMLLFKKVMSEACLFWKVSHRELLSKRIAPRRTMPDQVVPVMNLHERAAVGNAALLVRLSENACESLEVPLPLPCFGGTSSQGRCSRAAASQEARRCHVWLG